MVIAKGKIEKGEKTFLDNRDIEPETEILDEQAYKKVIHKYPYYVYHKKYLSIFVENF